MLQYEKAAVSNSAFKGDVVYYYDVKGEGGERRRGGGGEKREMSGEQHPEKREERWRDCFITIRGDEFASQRNGDQLMKLYRS